MTNERQDEPNTTEPPAPADEQRDESAPAGCPCDKARCDEDLLVE